MSRLSLGHQVRDRRDNSVGVFTGWTLNSGRRYARLHCGKRRWLVPERFAEKVLHPDQIVRKKRKARIPT